MKYFLIDDTRPVSFDAENGSVAGWDFDKGEMVEDPDLMLAVAMGVDDEFEPIDIEEVSKAVFESAQKTKSPKLTIGGKHGR